MWLTRLALRNPVLILMLSLMAVVLGWVANQRLSVDLFPSINIPVIRIATFYTGAGPATIEQAITQPIERAVAATPGVDRVESQSKQGVSLVSVWFNYDIDIDNAQFDVSQRVAQIMNALPPGTDQPFILKFDITNIPVAQVAISAEGMDERSLYDLAYNVIEPQIERLTGVASASVGGGKQREISVLVDRDSLRARGLGILDVVNTVKGANLELPSGNLRAGSQDLNVFANSLVEDPKQLEQLVLPNSAPSSGPRIARLPVRLSDIARVEDSVADQTEVVRINERRGVYLRVLKQPAANTVAVVDSLRKALTQLRGVPPNVKLDVSFDQSRYIRAAIESLVHETLQGGLLAVLVILVFLVSLRATAIVAVAIPLSIVSTFALLFFTGQTLNVFTLGGLALAVGRLVDDSIVELENIHRHLEKEPNRVKAVLDAAQEVAMPILVSTITTIVVFLPVVFLQGAAKNLFIPLALTIAFSLTISFLVSRTVTPLLCYYWIRPSHGQQGWFSQVGRLFTRWLDRLDGFYARALGVTLSHRVLTVSSILCLFVGSLFLSKLIGKEFFPDTDESQFSLTVKTPVGTRVERTEEVMARLESKVRESLGQHDGRDKSGIVTTMISSSGLPYGRTALFSGNTGPHAASLNVNLVPRTSRSLSDVQAAEIVRKTIGDEFPGVSSYFFVGGIVKRILNFGSPAPIDVEVLGFDLNVATEYSSQLQRSLRELSDRDGRPLLTDVQISREQNYPELDVNVDRLKAGVLGVDEQAVAQTVLTSLVGSKQVIPIRYSDPGTGNEYDINVRLMDKYRSETRDLNDIFVRSAQGGLVTLDTLAEVKRNAGPVLIARKYLQRIVDVTANVAPGKDLGTAANAVQGVLDQIPVPDGFSAKLGGQVEAQKSAFADLGMAAALALVLVYMVLASQFKSLLDPFIVMFSVPLGLTGVYVALWLTNTTLNMNSFMGIIMMVGIVVSNGVLLVDFANTLRERGMPLLEATIEAGRIRLRPILMTTIATVIGLLPVALGVGEGSEANVPLARAVIGGLTISTLFTLFLIPVLYTWFGRGSRHAILSDAPGAA